MSQLAYVAAEYFIEALGRSLTFCITYDEVHLLINQAGKDIVSYLKDESKKDFLFIFKKFPDVFIFNGFTVSLTDAFLSLYAFPSSANFSATYVSANAFETAAIEYFKLVLSRTKTCHYAGLFNILSNQNGLKLSQYFSGYKLKDMYSFFQTHSNTFTMLNNKVYLKINPSVEEVETLNFEKQTSSKCLTKLKKCAHFLLSCFESLHYIELKQCISFVLSKEKMFLNQHSLIKQREIFENLSETTMDEWGYLRLNDFSACMPKSRKVRLVVLIVCILGFEREMHFVKLVQEVNKRTSSDVTDLLCSLSISDQFKFFKSFTDHFVMGGNGYVSLLSSFVFPLCSFENSIQNLQTFQNTQLCVSNFAADNQNNLKSLPTTNNVLEKSQNYNGNLITELQTDLKSLQATTNVQANSQNSNCNNIQSTQSKTCIKSLQSASNVGVKSQNPDYNIANIALTAELQRLDAKFGNLNLNKSQISFSDNSGTVNARMKLSIVYLLSRFESPVCQNVIKSCLHILDDARIYFLKLSPSDQQNFIVECYNFFNFKLNEGLISDLVPYADNKEKTLLFIVYLLLVEGRMHVKKLSKTIISKKVCTLLLFMNISSQLEYFREMSGYFSVSSDGFISLYKTFDDINSVIDSHFYLLSKISASASAVSTNKELNPSKIIMLDDSSRSTDTSIIHNDLKIVSNGAKISSEIKALETDMPLFIHKYINILPLFIHKRLEHFLFYIQNYFSSLIANLVLETFLHSLTDVKTHFSNLSTNDQHGFVQGYFQYINNESVIEISPPEPQPSAASLTEEERIILLVTYMLIKEKSLHFQNIVRRLDEFEVKCSLCSKTTAEKFKHFKTLNDYFLINGDGYVCLNSSFFSVSSIINSVSAFSPAIQKILKSYIKIKNKPESDLEKKKISNDSSKSLVQNIVVNLNVHNGESKRNILITNETVKSNNVNSHSEMNTVVKNEIVKGYLSETSSDEVIDAIVDVCFSILSVCKKMQVEKLCCRLNSCDIKHIQNYFSFFTISEKTHFFTNMPQFFDVTRDGFVSLKEEAFSSYVPKCNLIPVNGDMQIISVSEKALCTEFSSRSQSGMSDSSTNKSCSSNNSRNRERPNRGPRTARKLIAPQALTNIKTFLNSEKSAKKFQNSWKTRCDNGPEKAQNIPVAVSRNSSVKSANTALVSSQNDSIAASQYSTLKTANVTSFSFKKTSSLSVSPKKSVKTIKATSASSQNIFPVSVPETSSVKTANAASASSQNTSVLISQNDGPVKTANAAYISSQSFTKERFNFFDSSSKKILQSSPNPSVFQFGTPFQMVSESSIQFPMPRQPLENLFTSKQNDSTQALNTVNPHMTMKGVNSGFESSSISSSALKYNALEQSKEIVKKCALKEQTTSGNLQSSNQSKLFSMDTLSLPVNCDNSNVHSKEIQNDSYVSYGTELLNSFLGELNPNLITNSSTVNHVYQNDQTENKEHNSSHSEQKSDFNNIENSFANSKTNDVKNVEPSRRNSQLKHSDLNFSKSSSFHESSDLTELRAVNFFCAIIGNYEIGVSADFLISHLNLALSEVQTFMFNHYGEDNLSFFSKHKKVFYVSPQTNNVYLLKRG